MGGSPTPSPFLLIGMGLTITICLVVGMALGYMAGEAIGLGVPFLFVGLVAGIASAVMAVRAEVKRYM